MKRPVKYGVLLIAGILGLAFFSCKKDHPSTYMGYDYFPNNVGHYVIYRCDSIVHTNGLGNITYHYQIKEVIQSIFTNNEGQPTMRIVRYKRTDSTVPWDNILTIQKVWTGNLLTTMAVRQEDNYSYIKLVFPLSLNESWNGNARNTLLPFNYTYTTINTPSTINGTRFDSTLTVFQYTNSNLENYAYYSEQYATGVGLIRKIVQYDTSTVLSSSPPDTNVSTTYGVWYTESYLSSGNQ